MRKLILVCAFILITGCTNVTNNPSVVILRNSNPVGEGGLLSKQPCGPPCFYGLIPGSTSDKDVGKTMQNLSTIFVGCKTFDFTNTGGYRGANCDYVNVGYNNGSTLEMVAFRPSSDLVIRQVVDQYGPPDLVSVGIVSLPESPDKTRMVLLYDQIQATLQLPDQNGTQFIIGPDTQISYVVYLSKDNYHETRDIPSNLAWHGFGTYIASP